MQWLQYVPQDPEWGRCVWKLWLFQFSPESHQHECINKEDRWLLTEWCNVFSLKYSAERTLLERAYWRGMGRMLPIHSMVTQHLEHVLLSVDDILTWPMGGVGKVSWPRVWLFLLRKHSLFLFYNLMVICHLNADKSLQKGDFCLFLSLASSSALSMIIGCFPIRISYPLKNHLRGIVRSESQCLFAFVIHVQVVSWVTSVCSCFTASRLR